MQVTDYEIKKYLPNLQQSIPQLRDNNEFFKLF